MCQGAGGGAPPRWGCGGSQHRHRVAHRLVAGQLDHEKGTDASERARQDERTDQRLSGDREGAQQARQPDLRPADNQMDQRMAKRWAWGHG